MIASDEVKHSPQFAECGLIVAATEQSVTLIMFPQSAVHFHFS
jgi:hypothetical protein